MSAHLKYGEVHPRTLLADLSRLAGDGRLSQTSRESVETYRDELAWREFYADVLWHHPGSARDYLRPQLARHAPRRRPLRDRGRAAARLAGGAHRASRSSTPGCGSCTPRRWVHNRVRMVVASFLVKDLHVEWQHGARYFMQMLRDGDLASNQHGWQWVAGTGTDAAPYFRVFNPVTQGEKFDPDGRVRAPVRARARAPAGQGRPHPVGRRGRLRPRVPASASSTTPPSGSRPSRGSARSAADAPPDPARRCPVCPGFAHAEIGWTAARTPTYGSRTRKGGDPSCEELSDL